METKKSKPTEAAQPMETAATAEPVVKSKVKTPVKPPADPAVKPVVESAVKTPVKAAVNPAVNPAVTPSGSNAAVDAGSPGTPKVPKKRGRPVGWRKYKDGESPPAKPKKARKSKSSSVSSPLSGPAPATSSSSSSQLECGESVVSSTENMETPGRASEEPRVQATKSAEDLPILPPKKFFKSKAALKEAPATASVTVSPPPSPPNHEHERDNFRSWLDAKLSGQNGVESEGISEILATVGRVTLTQPRHISQVQNIVE